MRRTAALLLLVLTACRPTTNVRVAGDEPASTPKPKSKASSGDGAEASSALIETIALWQLTAVEMAEPGHVEGWYRHAGSGTCLPTSHDDFTLAKQAEYGPNDESVTLISETRGTTVTLYVYPGAGALASEFASVEGSMRQSCGPGVGASFDIGDPRFPEGGKVGLCTHLLDNELEVVEQVVLFSRGDWYYKVRATWPAFLGAQAFPAIQQIMAAAFNTCEQS